MIQCYLKGFMARSRGAGAGSNLYLMSDFEKTVWKIVLIFIIILVIMYLTCGDVYGLLQFKKLNF